MSDWAYHQEALRRARVMQRQAQATQSAQKKERSEPPFGVCPKSLPNADLPNFCNDSINNTGTCNKLSMHTSVQQSHYGCSDTPSYSILRPPYACDFSAPNISRSNSVGANNALNSDNGGACSDSYRPWRYLHHNYIPNTGTGEDKAHDDFEVLREQHELDYANRDIGISGNSYRPSPVPSQNGAFVPDRLWSHDVIPSHLKEMSMENYLKRFCDLAYSQKDSSSSAALKAHTLMPYANDLALQGQSYGNSMHEQSQSPYPVNFDQTAFSDNGQMCSTFRSVEIPLPAGSQSERGDCHSSNKKPSSRLDESISSIQLSPDLRSGAQSRLSQALSHCDYCGDFLMQQDKMNSNPDVNMGGNESLGWCPSRCTCHRKQRVTDDGRQESSAQPEERLRPKSASGRYSRAQTPSCTSVPSNVSDRGSNIARPSSAASATRIKGRPSSANSAYKVKLSADQVQSRNDKPTESNVHFECTGVSCLKGKPALYHPNMPYDIIHQKPSNTKSPVPATTSSMLVDMIKDSQRHGTVKLEALIKKAAPVQKQPNYSDVSYRRHGTKQKEDVNLLNKEIEKHLKKQAQGVKVKTTRNVLTNRSITSLEDVSAAIGEHIKTWNVVDKEDTPILKVKAIIPPEKYNHFYRKRPLYPKFANEPINDKFITHNAPKTSVSLPTRPYVQGLNPGKHIKAPQKLRHRVTKPRDIFSTGIVSSYADKSFAGCGSPHSYPNLAFRGYDHMITSMEGSMQSKKKSASTGKLGRKLSASRQKCATPMFMQRPHEYLYSHGDGAKCSAKDVHNRTRDTYSPEIGTFLAQVDKELEFYNQKKYPAIEACTGMAV